MSYKVTYRLRNGKNDFIGAKDKSDVDEKVKELKASDHEIIDIEILKAKVYVKNPSDAPPGMKVEEGKRGGHYYESDQIEQYKKPKLKIPEVNVVSEDSDEMLYLLRFFEEEKITPKAPLSIDYINGIIKKHNINTGGAIINLLPCIVGSAFAFVLCHDPNNIYISAKDEQTTINWINDLKGVLQNERYSVDELNFNVEDKDASMIIHETGHTKVHKFVNLKDIKTQKEMEQIEYEKFKEYADYLIFHYGVGIDNIYEKLDEILAEDYRQLIGGTQSNIPNRYLYPVDTKNSKYFKYKEQRLNILRKMGVF